MKKGKLIVLDGGDGSGKTTQAKLLFSYFKKNNIPCKYMNFPQYYRSFYGKTIAKLLRGEFGDINYLSPYLISLAFALDRASARDEMVSFLKKGGVIVSNRYISSNLSHQGARFNDDKQKEEYIKWEEELEYKINKIPKEDIVIYLYIPYSVSAKLIEKKPKRHYLNGGKKDIYEKNIFYQQTVEKMYLSLCQRYKHWVKINCMDKNNSLLLPETVHQKVIMVLKDKLFDK